MKFIEQLLALKDELEGQSSTKRCVFEQVLLLERVIRMAKRDIRDGFRCENCVAWERNPPDSEDPGWGICRINSNLNPTQDIDWCIEGIGITEELCEQTE